MLQYYHIFDHIIYRLCLVARHQGLEIKWCDNTKICASVFSVSGIYGVVLRGIKSLFGLVLLKLTSEISEIFSVTCENKKLFLACLWYSLIKKLDWLSSFIDIINAPQPFFIYIFFLWIELSNLVVVNNLLG